MYTWRCFGPEGVSLVSNLGFFSYLLPSVTPSGAANYTTSHNQVELVLQPQVVKTGEVRVSVCLWTCARCQ